MCGIIAIVSDGDVNSELYEGLTVLQHRGQDAAGITTCEGRRVHMRKGNGLVRDVFQQKHMLNLRGTMGIGHVRYPTAGCSSAAEAQPFYVNSPYGISFAHNGNIVNAKQLKKEMWQEDLRHTNTKSDSEIVLNVFAHELQRLGKHKLHSEDVFEAVRNLHKRCQGGYACVVMILGYGIVAIRDPHGIRPVVFGKRTSENGNEVWCAASESIALDVLGFELVRDVQPGEAVIFRMSGEMEAKQCAENPVCTPCIFEHVYFARPDSMMDGISVYKARLRMGEKLAEKIQREWGPKHNIDVVIPVPDTSRTSALQLSYSLGVIYREGFIKNRYIGRTFIMPGQKQRKKSVRQKLNPIELEFKGKHVLLVDDSVVRGTTSREIIAMARSCGALSVSLASCAPVIRYPNVYGIDMPSASELVGHNRSVDEICKAINADRVIYQDLPDLLEASHRGNPEIKDFETSVFSGKYIAGEVTPEYLQELEQLRNDAAKATEEFMDLATMNEPINAV